MTRKRERYLDDFLKKMAQREYLFYSDEFQTFLRSEAINVSDLFEKWQVPAPLSIINRYKNTFSALDGVAIWLLSVRYRARRWLRSSNSAGRCRRTRRS
jgi:hypothetical protein